MRLFRYQPKRMSTPGTISKQPSTHPSLNFQTLRDQGMDLIRALSGRVWTDHNLHDPGITTLEVLCYALTDLGYRTRQVSDLFESTGMPEDGFIRDYFFEREELLPAAPLTAADFERKIETLPEVDVAWLNLCPVITSGTLVKGGYEIAVLLHRDPQLGDLNTDSIRIRLEPEVWRMDLVFFREDNLRMTWSGIDRITGCRPDLSKEPFFFEYEDFNFQLCLLLETEKEGTDGRKKETLRVKARGSVYPVGRNVLLTESSTDHRDAILERIGSTSFLNELTLLLYRERYKQRLLEDIRRAILPFRNLCENFVSWRVVNRQEIKIGLRITLREPRRPATNPDTNALADEIFDRLDLFLLDMASSREETAGSPPILYASNLIEKITDMEQVAAASIFNLNLYLDGIPTIPLKNEDAFENLELAPFSSYVPKISREKSTVRVVYPDSSEAADPAPDFFRQETEGALKPALPVPEIEEEPPTRTGDIHRFFEEMGTYISIREDFPGNYRLMETLPSNHIPKPEEIKLQQFKAYLLFFEQILADYLGDLSGFPGLLSVKATRPEPRDKAGELSPAMPGTGSLQRLSKVTDHLLARFATEDRIMVQEHDTKEMLLNKKRLLLADIPVITRYRGTGTPLTPIDKSIWGADLLSGFQKRIYRLAGIGENELRHARLSQETGRDFPGFYLVEHILLAGSPENPALQPAGELAGFLGLSTGSELSDPYSFRLTFVLPASNPDLKRMEKQVEKLVTDELPAHLLAGFRWLNEEDMKVFEKIYEQWLNALLTEKEPAKP